MKNKTAERDASRGFDTVGDNLCDSNAPSKPIPSKAQMQSILYEIH